MNGYYNLHESHRMDAYKFGTEHELRGLAQRQAVRQARQEQKDARRMEAAARARVRWGRLMGRRAWVQLAGAWVMHLLPGS